MNKTEELIRSAHLLVRWPKALRLAAAQIQTKEFDEVVKDLEKRGSLTFRGAESSSTNAVLAALRAATAGTDPYRSKGNPGHFEGVRKSLENEIKKQKGGFVSETRDGETKGIFCDGNGDCIHIGKQDGQPAASIRELRLAEVAELTEHPVETISIGLAQEMEPFEKVADLLGIPRPLDHLGLNLKPTLGYLAKKEQLAVIQNARGGHTEHRDLIEKIVEARIKALRRHRLPPEKIQGIQAASRNAKGSPGEAWLESQKALPAVDAIAFLIQTKAISDNGDRYFNDLAGTDGLGELKAPIGTDLGTITLEEFQIKNPEIADDLSGWLDGTKPKRESEKHFKKCLQNPEIA